MVSHMESTQLERFLTHILTPVYRITEDDTIRDAGMGMHIASQPGHIFIALQMN